MQTVLDALNNILKSAGDEKGAICTLIDDCGGLDRIEFLLSHENEDIYSKASSLLDAHLSDKVSRQMKWSVSEIIWVKICSCHEECQ